MDAPKKTGGTPTIGFRMTDNDRRILVELSELLGISQTDALRLAIRAMHRRESRRAKVDASG